MLVFINSLTKMVRIAPSTIAVTAEDIANLFVSHVFQQFGMPQELIIDRDSRFISGFFHHLVACWGIHHRMSMAYHPQKDGQTEVMNCIVEDYLWAFIGLVHDNWDELLPMAEFTINNSKNTLTGASPFYLNNGDHP